MGSEYLVRKGGGGGAYNRENASLALMSLRRFSTPCEATT